MEIKSLIGQKIKLYTSNKLTKRGKSLPIEIMLPGVVVFLLRHCVCHFKSLYIPGYLRVSFSTRVFHPNDRLKSSLFNEIFVYQELFCVVTLLPSSRKQNERRRQRENKKRNRFYKQNKNSERTTHLKVVKLDRNMAMRWSR